MRSRFLLGLFIVFVISAEAQQNKTRDTLSRVKTNEIISKQVDVIDIAKKFFHKRYVLPSLEQPDTSDVLGGPSLHPLLKQDTAMRQAGRIEFAIFPAVGYALQTGVTAIAATNVSFYKGNKSKTNLSTIIINPAISLERNQFMLPCIFDIWSKDNKFDFVGDWRYYKYPTYTYGLGGHSKLEDADMVDYSYVRLYETVLKHIVSDFYVGMSYNLDYHFDILEEGSLASFEQYNNNAQKTTSSGLSLNLIYDSRENDNYPINAFYGSFAYRSNMTYLGSDQNWQSAQLEFRKYIKVSDQSDNVLAFWNINWFTFGGKTPYFDLPSTGWDSYSNMGRGYIQGRLRGPGLIYLESEYRFGISRNGLLGGVLFANAQSVSEWSTNKFETVFPGAGVGLRLKVNKFSRANLAIDYGFGAEGSQGFFFNMSEVF